MEALRQNTVRWIGKLASPIEEYRDKQLSY